MRAGTASLRLPRPHDRRQESATWHTPIPTPTATTGMTITGMAITGMAPMPTMGTGITTMDRGTGRAMDQEGMSMR